MTTRTKLFIFIAALTFTGCTPYKTRGQGLPQHVFARVEAKWGLPAGLLFAIATAETQNGKITGDTLTFSVVDDVQRKYLRKLALSTGHSILDYRGSYAGAVGLMQILPATYYAYRQDGDDDGVSDILNPYDNLETSAFFLARMIGVHGSVRKAIFRYNRSNLYVEKVMSLMENSSS